MHSVEARNLKGKAKVASIVTKPQHGYVIDSSSDTDVEQHSQSRSCKTGRQRVCSHSLDLVYNAKIQNWFQQGHDAKNIDKVQPVDGMNDYFQCHKHMKLPIKTPHMLIPETCSYERNERIRQQKIIDQLANSDNLSICSDTGMARKRRSPRRR